LHIGHLRTSIVGDTFNRIARALGHTTYSWNHIGDWGKPMALIIAWIFFGRFCHYHRGIC
ncbi:MAG: arginine--tRNA ligase, partial [Alphaproteobacteria bacterium]|nr:arginine--tRNA ligase [Alphaproteobacteria bacterium]